MSTEVLPEGVSAADFAKAVSEFVSIVGQDNVLVGLDDTLSYRKIMDAIDEMTVAPSAAVMPDTVEQIQGILRVCNQYKIPVWTISTGRNFGYGSASPASRGQIVMDLRRMNKIIEVDPVLCTALIEPGVTYQQLKDYIDEKGYDLWVDCPSPSSLVGHVGNTLERGVGYTAYGEHFMMQCGMEVVLADGTVLRTGMGGVEGSKAWQCFKWGYGPYLDGIFTQSNYGVVTKLGFWLMPKPPVYRPFAVRFDKTEDLPKIVDTMRMLRMGGLIPAGGIIQSPLYEIAGMTKRVDIYDGEGAIPQNIIESEAAKLDLKAWNLYVGMYAANDEQMEVNWKIVKGAFDAIGGQVQREGEMGEMGNYLFRRPVKMMSGNMDLEEFSMYNFRGGGGSMWFAPVTAARGDLAMAQVNLATEILHKYGFDYICGYVVGVRDMHHIIDLLYNRDDPEEMKRAHDCFNELLDRFAAEGNGVYRVGHAFMDKVADTYGAAQKDINKRIKIALDPNGILAPGKSGIRI